MSVAIIGFSIFLIMFFIALLFKQPAVKGKSGELFVAFFLKRMLNKDKYRVFNDVMIPDDAGGTTQIDHVVLSPYGIFVIETKNMKGWIFGDRDSATWTQQIYRCKNKFQNPFRQNYKHILCLAQVVDLPMEVMKHVVIFTGVDEIKNREKMPEALVTCVRELIAYIKTFDQPVLSAALLDHTENLLKQQRLANTYATRRGHVKHVQSIVNAINNGDDKVPVCPACGGTMVRRTAAKGPRAGKDFWGCSKYPQCRCTININ